MRRVLALVLALFALMAPVALAQQVYTNDKVEYTFEIPSATWRAIVEPDAAHEHPEFIYGDRVDGYLRIRKEPLEAGLTIKEFARHDQDQRTRYLPGYVDGKDEPFAGRLSGVTLSYEFTERGKPMAGRTYYLQGDSNTVYVLRFTGLRDKLLRIRNQTDGIARSMRLK